MAGGGCGGCGGGGVAPLHGGVLVVTRSAGPPKQNQFQTPVVVLVYRCGWDEVAWLGAMEED